VTLVSPVDFTNDAPRLFSLVAILAGNGKDKDRRKRREDVRSFSLWVGLRRIGEGGVEDWVAGAKKE